MAFNEIEAHLDICDKLIDLGIMFQEENLVYNLYEVSAGHKVQYFGRTGVIQVDNKKFNGKLEDLK